MDKVLANKHKALQAATWQETGGLLGKMYVNDFQYLENYLDRDMTLYGAACQVRSAKTIGICNRRWS